MKSSNANKHLTLEERIIIDHGIRNGSSKSAISTTLGKDKSTIGKEIKVHQKLTYKCPLPLECTAYKHSNSAVHANLRVQNMFPFMQAQRQVSWCVYWLSDDQYMQIQPILL